MTRKLTHRFLLLLALFMLKGGIMPAAAATAHDFSFTSIDGGDLPLAKYRGKVVLLVNTASMCGFTGQYEGLQSLWTEYKDKGLVVLGVPSDDFGGQELDDAKQVKEFCTLNYGIDFPMAILFASKAQTRILIINGLPIRMAALPCRAGISTNM